MKKWSYCFSAQKIEAGATGPVTLLHGVCLLTGSLCWQGAEARPATVSSFPRFFSFFDIEAKWILFNSMTREPQLILQNIHIIEVGGGGKWDRFSVCS